MATQAPEDRPPLTREYICTCAAQLADDEGLRKVTMRNVATRTGYEVMSLYNHVDNKADLHGGMVDAVVRHIPHPVNESPWKPAVREIAVNLRDALLAHPWAAELWTSAGPQPAILDLVETTLRVLADSPLDEVVADLVYHAVFLHVVGYTQQQFAYDEQKQLRPDVVDDLVRTLSPDRFPHVLDHMHFHQRVSGTIDEFEFTLDLILNGAESATVE